MASTIKVDNVQNQPGTNIINKCGTTITLGASSDTIALACGASQTGFGRTGTVDWITTPKVTGDSPITGVTGKGYFLNTTAGTITVNLPAGAAGSIISMADYARTWDSNAVTVTPNGSEKIGGVNSNATLNTEGQSVTFVYIDSTQGWVNVQDSTSAVAGATYIVATGGTPCAGTTCGNYKIHTFTGPGTFCVSSIGNTPACNVVDYLVVAGGGGGGGQSSSTTSSGGGGAGGYRESPGTATGCYTVSPLGAAPAVALPVTVTGYPVAVGGGGAGGAAGYNNGVKGTDSVFTGSSTITSTGGGYGSGTTCVPATGGPGGSGGGAKQDNQGGPLTGKGPGNDPPVNPAQGMPGGRSDYGGGTYYAGGGGGATVAGGDYLSPGSVTGNGGTGATSSINATPTARAGGGGAGRSNYPGSVRTEGSGGAGGGGAGVDNSPTCGSGPTPALSNATVNTGGGGGGAAGGPGPQLNAGGSGGSGIVILRYKFQ